MQNALTLRTSSIFSPRSNKNDNSQTASFFADFSSRILKQKMLSRSIISYGAILLPNSKWSEKKIAFGKLQPLVIKAEAVYADIYGKKYGNRRKYATFFTVLENLHVTKRELYLYDFSVRCDVSNKDSDYIIEYSKDDDFLTVTKMSGKKVIMKECTFKNLQAVIDSFGER